MTGRLIAQLRIDGRASLSKLAELLDVARGTVQNRLDRLQECGILLGFTVRIREEFDSQSVQAVMMIEVTGKTTAHVIRKLRGISEIHSLHTTNGNWDLIAQIRAANLGEFDRVLREVRMIEASQTAKRACFSAVSDHILDG